MIFTGAAVVAGVAGWPIDHSRSPQIHNYWLQKYGIDGVYAPFAISPTGAVDAFRLLPFLGLAGVNVTVPYKEIAFRAMDEVDSWSERLRAVNTIVVRDGKLHGTNTDAYGFLESLREAYPEWYPDMGPVVIIGAGGAARSIIAGLQDAGTLEIRLTNRTQARADALRGEFGESIQTLPWEKRVDALKGAALLVNTTSLGMTGQPALDLTLDALPPDAAVCDIVYAPLETPLLAAARARGNVVIDGLGMLLHQARPGFREWFGADPEVDQMLRDHVLSGL